MIRMAGPDCAVIMCNSINTYTYTQFPLRRINASEWHRMTRVVEPDCAVMCKIVNIHTHTERERERERDRERGRERQTQTQTQTHTQTHRQTDRHTHTQHTHIPPWEDQCEWHRMTRMTGPDCGVMCNSIIHTHTPQDFWLVFHSGPYRSRVIFRVAVCFGTRGEEDLLSNRWTHWWAQQA